MQLAILFPDKRSELALGEEKWNELREWLGQSKDPERLAEYAGLLALVYPEKRAEILAKIDLDQMQLELQRQRSIPNWYDLAKVAKNLTILSAENAVVTADGRIQITKKPKPIRAPRPLPERPAV